MDSTYLLCFWYKLALMRETYFVCLEINFIRIYLALLLFTKLQFIFAFLCGIQLYVE